MKRNFAYIGGAFVTATARFRNGKAVQAGPALSRYRKPWHEMDLNLNKNGSWDVHVVIDGPRGQAQVTFQIDVGSE